MFLCCGDALFDMFVSPVGSSGSAGSSDSSASAVALAGNVGGSTLNVATGLAKLGHHSRFFTKLSADPFGQRMRSYLAHNNIDTGLCLDTNLNTTLAIVETAEDGSASYVFYTENTADVSISDSELPAALPEDVKALHFSSYSTAVEPVCTTLANLAARERGNCLISYDPNLRTSIEPDIDKWREMFGSFAANATLIKASDEDIETLLGKNREEQFVADSFAHGAELVFVTRGPDGASGYKPDGQVTQVPGVKVDVVDTVGAGDTFQACMLHWLATEGHLQSASGQNSSSLQGEVDLQASMTFSTRGAAVTCTRSGADMPSLADLA